MYTQPEINIVCFVVSVRQMGDGPATMVKTASRAVHNQLKDDFVSKFWVHVHVYVKMLMIYQHLLLN